MILGGTFWIPAAPRYLFRTAAAPLYIQTPDQQTNWPYINNKKKKAEKGKKTERKKKRKKKKKKN